MVNKTPGKVKSPFLERNTSPAQTTQQQKWTPHHKPTSEDSDASSVNSVSKNKGEDKSVDRPGLPRQKPAKIKSLVPARPSSQMIAKQAEKSVYFKTSNDNDANSSSSASSGSASATKKKRNVTLEKITAISRPRLEVPPSPSQVRRQSNISPNRISLSQSLDCSSDGSDLFGSSESIDMYRDSSQLNLCSLKDGPKKGGENSHRKRKRKAKKLSLQKKMERFVTSSWSDVPLGLLYGFIFFVICNLVLETEEYSHSQLNETRSYNLTNFSVSKENTLSIGAAVGAATAMAVSMGSFLSLNLKTTFLLMVPPLLAGRGRAVLLSIGFGLLVKGPIGNIEANVEEGVRSLVCMYEQMEELALNYTEQMTTIDDDLEEMIEEFEKTLFEMRNEMAEQHKELQEKVAASLEKLKDIKKAGQAWGFLGKACDKVVGVLKFLKLKDCSAPDFGAIDSISKNIKGTLNNTINDLKNIGDIVDINTDNLMGELKGHNIEEIEESLKNILRLSFQVFQRLIIIFEKLLYFLILLCIVDARHYIKNYFLKDSFDNFLVDTNVKRLWRKETTKRCRTMDKLTPIRNWEKRQKYRSTFDKKLSELERKELLAKSLPALIFTLVAMTAVTLDLLLIQTMQVVSENAEYGITYDGMEAGVGFDVAFGNFNKSSSSTMNIRGFNLSTAECLPRASKSDSFYLIKLVFTIVAVFVSAILNAYTVRLNSKICNLFFKDRAEERARFLYQAIQTGQSLMVLKRTIIETLLSKHQY